VQFFTLNNEPSDSIKDELPGYVEKRQLCSPELPRSKIREIVFEMFFSAAKRWKKNCC